MLTDYRREAERLGAERTLLVATSAVRDAENGEAFLGEVEWSYGFVTQLLSGDEEAELMLRGVGEIEPGTLVLDIGGGSTELVTLDSRASLDIGAVRLTERFLHSEPPTRDELKLARSTCALAPAARRDERRRRCRNDHEARGARPRPRRVRPRACARTRALARRRRTAARALAALPLAERREVPALEPERAPVIVAGAVIAREVLAAYGLDATG